MRFLLHTDPNRLQKARALLCGGGALASAMASNLPATIDGTLQDSVRSGSAAPKAYQHGRITRF